MKENYSYPLDYNWSKEEIVIVMELWQALEQVYESSMEVEDFKHSYQKFKKVVPSIGEEKKLGKEFEEIAGYSLYRVVQKAKSLTFGRLKM